MDASTEILFTDPVLQRIFFDCRRLAPRSDQAASEISTLRYSIAEMQVKFLKADRLVIGEYWQRKMRSHWFAMRGLADGYFMVMSAGHDDGCQHVVQFTHDNADASLQVDFKKRAALWHRYERRPPPPWRRSTRRYRRSKKKGDYVL